MPTRTQMPALHSSLPRHLLPRSLLETARACSSCTNGTVRGAHAKRWHGLLPLTLTVPPKRSRLRNGPRAPPILFWQNFSGPCCVKKTAQGGVKTDDSDSFIEAQPAGGTITIAPGVDMPIISNGYSPFTANNATTAALEEWFRVGGRSVDTAFEYSNEPWVGDAVRAAVAGGLPRKEIFVITKIKCRDFGA